MIGSMTSISYGINFTESSIAHKRWTFCAYTLVHHVWLWERLYRNQERNETEIAQQVNIVNKNVHELDEFHSGNGPEDYSNAEDAAVITNSLDAMV